MNKKLLLPLLAGFTLVVAACSDSDKGANYTGAGEGGNLPGGGTDSVDANGGAGMGIPPSDRVGGNFNPDTDVNYDTLNSDTVYFAFDSSTIPAQEQGKLEAVSEYMKNNPGQKLFLAGHADKRGTPEYNRGERRALAEREYLVGLGLSAGSLYTNSYGSDRPAVEGDTEEAYAKNRRVQIGLVTQKP
jgi:outer membrane protein OmpA-like peptidoglycan-associated protein